jgi:Rab5 GDP/GTP exchange factor
VVDVRGIVHPASPSHAGEESAQPLSLPTPAQTISEDAKRLLQKTGDTISKPLNAISRIFSEALDGAEGKLSYLPGPFAPFELGRERQPGSAASSASTWARPDGVTSPQTANSLQSPIGHVPLTPHSGDGQQGFQTPYKPRVRRIPSPSYASPGGSPGFFPEDTPSRSTGQHSQSLSASYPSQPPPLPPRVQTLATEQHAESISRTPTPGLDLAGIEAEIDAATENAASASKETLRQIFPAVDREVIDWVLEAQSGDLGKSIEALLEMSSGS